MSGLILEIDKSRPYRGREEAVRLSVRPKWFADETIRVTVYSDGDALLEGDDLAGFRFGRARTRDSEFEARVSDGWIYLLRDSADNFDETIGKQLSLGRVLTLTVNIRTGKKSSRPAVFLLNGNLYGCHDEIAGAG